MDEQGTFNGSYVRYVIEQSWGVDYTQKFAFKLVAFLSYFRVKID